MKFIKLGFLGALELPFLSTQIKALPCHEKDESKSVRLKVISGGKGIKW